MAENECIDRIIGSKERRALVPYSDMHVSRLERAGLFPKRIRLGANRIGWSLREVEDWIEERKRERCTADDESGEVGK